jgi:hypothetical protein
MAPGTIRLYLPARVSRKVTCVPGCTSPRMIRWKGGNLDYHMVSDEPQYVDDERLTGIGRYIHDVTRMLTERGQKPVPDQPAPDPDAICRQ